MFYGFDEVIWPEDWLPLLWCLASCLSLGHRVAQQQVRGELVHSQLFQVIVGEGDDPGPFLKDFRSSSGAAAATWVRLVQAFKLLVVLPCVMELLGLLLRVTF